MKLVRSALRLAGGLLALYLVTAAVVLNGCAGPLRVDPLQRAVKPPVVDEHLDLAREYAPWFLHGAHPEQGRQDLPTAVDFDGDLNGENHWDNFPLFELVPTVYYAVLETGTHWFLSYHLFHPRDWTPFDLGVHLSHEGDGENLQVVVRKADGKVVLLFTQAHFVGEAYANPGSGFGPGEKEIRGPFRLVEGTHAAVFVESHGHGIYGSESPEAETPADGWGYTLVPAAPGEEVFEPEGPPYERVLYRLESTTARLWPLLASGAGVGEGRLWDGAVPYEDARVKIGVPRYYEADRWSGPFGPDRGISPFAVDFAFSPPRLGALFFDPARRYAECLRVPEPWSRDYREYPFVLR